MQSNGGVMTPEAARRRAGGDDGIRPGRRHHRVGARSAKTLGYGNVISFDMGGTTAKASLVRDGEPTMARGLLRRRLCQRPSGDGAGRSTSSRSAPAAAASPGSTRSARSRSVRTAPAPIPARSAIARGGTEPTITDANVMLGRIGAARFSRRRDGARRATRATRGIDAKDRRAARHDRDASGARPSSRSRSPRCRSRCAKSRSRGATIRAISSLVASGGAGRCTSLAIARELHIPTVIVPRVPVAFLGPRHADGRRAPRFRAHLLQRSRRRSISPRSDRASSTR